MLTLEVNSRPVEFLVDTGATYSTLNYELPKNLISDETTEVRGFSGAITRLPFSKELAVHEKTITDSLFSAVIFLTDKFVGKRLASETWS